MACGGSGSIARRGGAETCVEQTEVADESRGRRPWGELLRADRVQDQADDEERVDGEDRGSGEAPDAQADDRPHPDRVRRRGGGRLGDRLRLEAALAQAISEAAATGRSPMPDSSD